MAQENVRVGDSCQVQLRTRGSPSPPVASVDWKPKPAVRPASFVFTCACGNQVSGDIHVGEVRCQCERRFSVRTVLDIQEIK